jgi:recombination DNA repair RAD52 pathway protein
LGEGEEMKSLEELRKELDAKIPRDVIETREGGNGIKLSYLSGHYVIDRLNKVLGQGNWDYHSDVQLLHAGEIQGKYGPVQTVHYSARVTLRAVIGDKETRFTDYGYGDGTDKTNIGKAHELAIKEAITDGIKRCAKSLGMSLGLALYSKEQENVEDSTKSNTDRALNNRAAEGASRPSIPNNGLPSKHESNKGAESKAPAGKDERQKTIDLIGSTSRVVVAKSKATVEQLKELLKTHGAEKKEDLSLESAKAFLTQLEGMLK